MKKSRRKFSAKFKAMVAIEALNPDYALEISLVLAL
jgi:hypothetical protein